MQSNQPIQHAARTYVPIPCNLLRVLLVLDVAVAARDGPAATHEPEIVAIIDRDLVATADVVRGRNDDGRASAVGNLSKLRDRFTGVVNEAHRPPIVSALIDTRIGSVGFSGRVFMTNR